MHTLLSTQHLGISDAENHHSGLSSQSLRGAVCGRALQGDFAAAATADSGKASFEDGIAAAKSHSLQSQTGPFDGSMLSGSNRLSTSPAAAASSSGAATSASCAEAADENSPESASFLPPSSSESKRFFVGQWIDVKDTVNQWLEATVMAVNEEQGTVFLHYNGWPTRWDEWIQIDSPRIAPFRTR
jgi:hypothetical protein